MLWLFTLMCASVGVATVNTTEQAAEPCNPERCRLPDCFCSGTAIPNNLPAEKIPQIVMLTFEGAVNTYTAIYPKQVLSAGITNPNDCGITGTFFVSHEYTDYREVMAIRHKRNEIAVNTVSPSSHPPYWWAEASKEQWKAEIGDMKEILRKWGQIQASSIVGFRAPKIQVGGNNEFGALHDLGFLYESSMPTQNSPNRPMWPYTLDYESTQDCEIPPCPTGTISEGSAPHFSPSHHTLPPLPRTQPFTHPTSDAHDITPNLPTHQSKSTTATYS